MGEKRWYVVVLIGVVFWGWPAWAAIEISPAFIGMYRKTMEIEEELVSRSVQNGIDPHLVRAVVIQDSGGNIQRGEVNLPPKSSQMSSAAVCTPKTPADIEQNVKYLAYLQRQFDREDYVMAAYYDGPGAVDGKPLRLDTLQRVINVGLYKSVLQRYEPEIRRQVQTVHLRAVKQGESWKTLARTTGIPAAVLRLYNPCLAAQPLRLAMVIAYPSQAPEKLLEYEEGAVYYTSRLGDTQTRLAQAFGVASHIFQSENDLWHLQQLPTGVRLHASLPVMSAPDKIRVASRSRGDRAAEARQRHKVRRGETLEKIARRYGISVAALMRANNLRRANYIQAGMWLSIPGTGRSTARSTGHVRRHKVQRGETLEEIARRYGISVTALMRANNLRNSRILAGNLLVIPAKSSSRRVVVRKPRRHRVKWGETLGKIARRYRTSVAALMRVNNLSNSRIHAGALLLIPR